MKHPTDTDQTSKQPKWLDAVVDRGISVSGQGPTPWESALSGDRQDGLLTLPEFCGRLKITVSCGRRWILERQVTYIKVGRLVRIPASEVLRSTEAGRRPAKGV